VDFNAFAELFRNHLPEGLVLNNPGGGTSTIVWCDGERVCYRRGDLRLYVGLRELHAAYTHFAGRDVTTRQLKDNAPTLFDSNRGGHNCHCTLFFLALQRMGLVGELWGRGQAGSPFGVTVPAPQDATKHPLHQSAHRTEGA
jgi:hypothetical protein